MTIYYYGYNKINNNELGWYLWNDIIKLQWIISNQIGASELTINYNQIIGSWYTFRIGFLSTNIRLYMSVNNEITNTYQYINVYDIPYPYNNLNDYFCYASKSHPELIHHQQNELVFTYMCNTWNFTLLFDVNNTTVYIPQFVVVNYTYNNHIQ